VSDSRRKIVRDLRRQGFTIVRTRRGHLKISQPGVDGFVIAPGNTGDWRQPRNTKAKLRVLARRFQE
jgi:hypothetical protein